MNKNEINELYKRFIVARSEMVKTSVDLAKALNTPDNCKIICKKTRTAFRKGSNNVKSVDLWDERNLFDLFKMLNILDIIDGSFEEPAEEVEIYDEEVVIETEPPVLAEEVVEMNDEEVVEIYDEEVVVNTYVAPELDIEVVDELLHVEEPVEEPLVEKTPVETYAPVTESYASLEATYESASDSYDDSSDSSSDD